MAKKKLVGDMPEGLAYLVFKQSPASIVVTDPKGVIQYVNPKFVKLTGYKLKEAIGQNPRILKSGRTSDKEYATMWQTITSGREWRGEFLNKKKSGELYWEIASISPVKNKKGEITYFVAVKEDITDRKKAETEFLKSNQILRAISRGSQAVMRVADEFEFLREACRIITKDCGYSMVWVGYAENNKEKTVKPVASAGFAKGYLDKIKVTWADNQLGRGPTGTAIRTGKITKCENMLTDPKFAPWREAARQRGYASSIVFPLKLAGRIFGAISIYSEETNPFTEDEVRLLTELINVLATGIGAVRLRQKVNHLASFPRLNVMPVIEVNLSGQVAYVNPAGLRAFPDLKKKGANHPLLLKLNLKKLKGGAEPFLFEAKIDDRWYSSAAKFLPETSQVRIYCMDITKRMEALDELAREKNRLIEMEERQRNFIAILGHELRNPLASIVLALDLIATQKNRTLSIQEELDVIGHQTNNMSKLLKDLLDVSRLDRGRLELEIKNVDLTRIIYNTLGSIRPLLGKNKRQLKISGHLESVKILADRLRIEQILINLLSNAVKYSKEGSLIELSVDRQGGEAFVVVRDNGMGIPANKLLHIFDLFSQGEQNAQTKKSGGLGVGLYMSRELARLHGGEVTASSEGVGKGSEFTLRLPIKAKEIPEKENFKTKKLSHQVKTPTSQKLRVLSVDDNVELAKFIGQSLKLLGCEARVVHDGQTALKVLRRFKPQFALLDLGMPKMDGFELARRIKADKKLASITLVAITGFGQERDKDKAKRAGFEYYIVKPLRIDDLSKLLSEEKSSFQL